MQADELRAAVVEKNNLDIDVVVHDSIDSTNNWCLQQCKAGKMLPFTCFAEAQTSGRGRRGKRWVMSAHSNIAMSVVWPFELLRQPLHLLPLSVALAIVEILEGLGMNDLQIKWPNDVYVHGKKIAGVLIETQPVKDEQVNEDVAERVFAQGGKTKIKQLAVVVGVGLNYDMSSYDKTKMEGSLVLTDICRQLEQQKNLVMPERNAVASILLRSVIKVCRDFKQVSGNSLEKFRTQYDFCKGKRVEVVLDNKEVLSGVAQGVTDSAELLVLVDGEQHVFSSADVSVKANI